jgi:hypothetical protein
MTHVHRTVACALVLLSAFATAAFAQQTKTPRKGEEIVVKQTTSGVELRGKLVELSDESVSLLVEGSRIDLPLERVLRVDATRDSIVNGAVIGAAVLGGMCALACGQGLDSAGELPKAVLANAGWGALAGAIIDWRRKGRVPIYIKPARSGSSLQVRLTF